MFNTPYVIEDYPEPAFIDYVERELALMKAKKPRRTDHPHGNLMKYSPDPDHWSESVHCTCSGDQAEVIFLTGTPGIRKSIPHG